MAGASEQGRLALGIQTAVPVALGGGSLPVEVRCKFPRGCRGDVQVQVANPGGGWISVGRGAMTIAFGKTRAVPVTLLPAARHTLADGGPIAMEAVADTLDSVLENPQDLDTWQSSVYRLIVVAPAA